MVGESRAFAWLAFGTAVLVLASPLKLLWVRSSFGFIGPFILWGALIAVGAWLSRTRGP